MPSHEEVGRCPAVAATFEGSIYSWERVWRPVDPSLVTAVPYLVVLVELPAASSVRLIGNLIDPPEGPIPIGGPLEEVFEHHESHTLVLWRRHS
jgi:hypothetical protein